jgi:hypothetical protein
VLGVRELGAILGLPIPDGVVGLLRELADVFGQLLRLALRRLDRPCTLLTTFTLVLQLPTRGDRAAAARPGPGAGAAGAPCRVPQW